MYSRWRIIYRPKRQRLYWNWRPEGGRPRSSRRWLLLDPELHLLTHVSAFPWPGPVSRGPGRSNTQTHDGGSGLSQASRSLSRRSMPRGRSGAIFLHPEQRQWIERDYAGPARVAGSAGTGKTVVAIHRAAHLARSHPEARVLLATFSEPLARLLEARLRRLVSAEPRVSERIEVYALDALGKRLYEAQIGTALYATRAQIEQVLTDAVAAVGDDRFSLRFLHDEWTHVVDAWQVRTWGEYRDVPRLGRRTRLPEARRRGSLDGVRSRAQATSGSRSDHACGGLHGISQTRD